MALRISLSPTRSSYRPGEVVTASIEVSNDSDASSISACTLQVASLAVECMATERIDHTWVSLAYAAEVLPVEKDSRRETREMFRSAPTTLAEQVHLQPGVKRTWTVKFRLPEALPPSFKGVAARFTYILQASALVSGAVGQAMSLQTHRLSLEQAKRSSSARGASLSIPATLLEGKPALPLKPNTKRLKPQVATVKVPLHLWPAQIQAEGLERRQSGLSHGIVAGEDAELPPVNYKLGAASYDIQIEAQEVNAKNDDGLPKQRKQPILARGISLSRSDLHNNASQPEASPRSIRPTDAWPQLSQGSQLTREAVEASLAGSASSHRRQPSNWEEESVATEAENRAGEAERQLSSPLTSTPLTSNEPAALRSYNLRLSDHALVRLQLHPPSEGPLRLGATLSGTLDFRASQEAASKDPSAPKCVQVVILLETEEYVQPRWNVATAGKGPPSGIRKVYDEHQELTPDLVLTHFMLSIPFDAPMSFSSHLVALRWLLRFEFTTSAVQQSAGWLGGSSKGVERLTWTLPILVKVPGI